ncbi:hypothetical protein ACFE04_002696 [Oxalis oulophora]
MQQILQWLFKSSDEQTSANNKATTINEIKDIVVYKESKTSQKSKRRSNKTSDHTFGCCKIFIKPIFYLCREDVSKACFYSTINLRRPENLNKDQNWVVKMKKEDIINITKERLGLSNKAEAGNKVLPISENGEQCENKDKSNKAKTLSRMKELIRWAAATKSEKGAKFISRKFRNRGTLKALPGNIDDQLESPKISFRWDAESCNSRTSSAISIVSSSRHKNVISLTCTPNHDKDLSFNRKGNWITTDSDCKISFLYSLI